MTTQRGPSLTLRLTLLFALASALVLFLLGILISIAIERHFEEQDMDIMSVKVELVRHMFFEQTHAPWPKKIPQEQLDSALFAHNGLILSIRDADGRTVYANSAQPFPFEQGRVGNDFPFQAFKWRSADGYPMRGIVTRLIGSDASRPLTLGVAIDISHHEHFMQSFRHTLWSFVALATLVMGMLGGFVAQRGLAPLQAIKRRAAEITARNLSTRLPTEAIPQELAELTRVLNDMLSRLEESFQRLSDFSTDLAHELRTPISNLLTQTQVSLSQARSVEAYRDILASNAEEFERLSRMVSDMLFLAQADNRQIIPAREPVDLAEAAQSLLEYYGILAEEKHLKLTLSGQGRVTGDRLMLRRALSNLLSNAIRHTPEQGCVAIRIQETGQETVELQVENSGPAIPPEHMERLFDRFYRAEISRHRTTEGTGLGLAITRSILRAHGGDIRVSSADQTTCFTLTLPTSPKT